MIHLSSFWNTHLGRMCWPVTILLLSSPIQSPRFNLRSRARHIQSIRNSLGIRISLLWADWVFCQPIHTFCESQCSASESAHRLLLEMTSGQLELKSNRGGDVEGTFCPPKDRYWSEVVDTFITRERFTRDYSRYICRPCEGENLSVGSPLGMSRKESGISTTTVTDDR